MKRPYCCDESRELYQRYYGRQQDGKGEFPVYVGRHVQKGHGIGNIIGSLFRRILPVLKSLAPHVLRTGARVIEDVSEGKSWKDSAIKRVPEGIGEFRRRKRPPEDDTTQQTGSGKRRKIKDIFD